MIRTLAIGLALLAAAPAAHSEGGPIRSGEHDGFSRIVMEIEPATEWTLERTDGGVVITFPRKAIEFETTDIFRLIPRTRIQAVETRIDPAGTSVSVALACDCRVSTVFVAARYLALDIGDRDAALPAVGTDNSPPDPSLMAAVEPGDARDESPEGRATREVAAVRSAEEILIRQIERAADQGLIELADSPVPLPDDAQGPAVDATPPLPVPPVDSAPPVLPLSRGAGSVPRPAALADLLDHDQIRATTVFDRDRAQLAGSAVAPAPPVECLDDAKFAVGDWADARPPFVQIAERFGQLLKEFDAADPLTLEAMARIYIRFGLGVEAEQLLAAFPAPDETRPLLVDLARAVDGRDSVAPGPLSVRVACAGAHGLWLALAGQGPAYRDAAHFDSLSAAFADLPPDLRVLLGPRLIGTLLDEDQAGAARMLYDLTIRPEPSRSADLALAEARLVAAEGSPAAAVRALGDLVEAGSPNATDALRHLARLAVDGGAPLPDRLVSDLEAVALQQRGTRRGPEFRALLAETLARRGDISAAIANLRDGRADWPSDARFSALAITLLGAADPAESGAAAYAETVLGSLDLLPNSPDTDLVRTEIARRLLGIGLAAAARELVSAAVARGDASARLLDARAALELGAPDEALAALADIEGVDAAGLRARAHARDGSFDAAIATLVEAGLDQDAASYAWPSGDWKRAEEAASEDPARQAMVRYMQARSAPDAAVSDAARGGEPPGPEAFTAPLPDLDPPSLEAARRLLATGREVEAFVADLLSDR